MIARGAHARTEHNKAHKQRHLLYTMLLFGNLRELMMELKYFDALDDFQHQTCMMECSWCPKRNPCSLFRTKDDQTQLQEFFIVVSWIRPFQSCLAELHHCSRTADVWLSSMSFSYVVWSIIT